jgi:hypothetical protein
VPVECFYLTIDVLVNGKPWDMFTLDQIKELLEIEGVASTVKIVKVEEYCTPDMDDEYDVYAAEEEEEEHGEMMPFSEDEEEDEEELSGLAIVEPVAKRSKYMYSGEHARHRRVHIDETKNIIHPIPARPHNARRVDE